MKKICNFRLMPLIFLSMILASMLVYFSFYISHYGFDYMLVASCICGLSLSMLGLILMIRKWLIDFVSKNYIYIFIVLTFFTISMGVSFISLSRYDLLKSMYDVEVKAHVTNVANIDSGYKVELSKVYISDNLVSEHIVMYVYKDSIDIAIGDNVKFIGDIRVASLYGDSINLYSFVNNTPYTVYSYNNLTVSSGVKSISETIRTFVKDKLVTHLDRLNASVVYATMFGEKTEIPDDTYSMFSLSGVSHILAVSGLHVSIFVTMLGFILSKLKVDSNKTFVITLLVIMFYAMLCNFTASVVRAGIMSLVLLFSKVVFRKYDSLSSLSFAGLLYMIISPLSIFTVGFQLSYLCVFAIITLAPYLDKALCFIKVPKALASTLGISIAVNLVIFPVAANVFDSVSMVGIISNIVVLPIFNVVYIMSLVVILVSVLPIFNFLYAIVNVGVGVLLKIIEMFSYMDLLNFTVFNISYMAMFVIILMLLILRFSLVKPLIKNISVVLLFIVTMCYISAGFIPAKFTGISTMIDYQSTSNVAIYTVNHKNVLVGANITEKQLNKILKNRKINVLDYVVAFDITNIDSLGLFSKYSVSKIYVHDNLLDANYDTSIIKSMEDTVLIENVMTITKIERANKILALDIYVHGTNILHLNKSLTLEENRYIAYNVYKDYDYTIAANFRYNLNEYTDIDFGYIVCHGMVTNSYSNVIDMENCYFYEINIKNGI